MTEYGLKGYNMVIIRRRRVEKKMWEIHPMISEKNVQQLNIGFEYPGFFVQSWTSLLGGLNPSNLTTFPHVNPG